MFNLQVELEECLEYCQRILSPPLIANIYNLHKGFCQYFDVIYTHKLPNLSNFIKITRFTDMYTGINIYFDISRYILIFPAASIKYVKYLASPFKVRVLSVFRDL